MKTITYFSFPSKWFHFQDRPNGSGLENRRRYHSSVVNYSALYWVARVYVHTHCERRWGYYFDEHHLDHRPQSRQRPRVCRVIGPECFDDKFGFNVNWLPLTDTWHMQALLEWGRRDDHAENGGGGWEMATLPPLLAHTQHNGWQIVRTTGDKTRWLTLIFIELSAV